MQGTAISDAHTQVTTVRRKATTKRNPDLENERLQNQKWRGILHNLRLCILTVCYGEKKNVNKQVQLLELKNSIASFQNGEVP